MGNIGLNTDHFSLSVQKLFFPEKWAKNWPSNHEESPYDPLEGFPKGRKIREMKATEAEMNSAKLKPSERDYCAHRLLEYRGCMKNNRPFYFRCSHERHHLEECLFEDQILRHKEWERERRIRERELNVAK